MADGYMRFEDLQRIADPVVMGGYVINQVPTISKFAQSGVFNYSNTNNLAVNGPGFVTSLMHINLNPVRSEPVNDDPDDEIQPQKLGTGMSSTVKLYNAFDVGIMEIVKELSLTSDPLRLVQQYDAQLWAGETDRYGAALLATAMDVAEAAHAGRYTLNIATETGAGANADNRVSPEAVLETLHKDGTGWERYTTAIMSSRVYLQLQKQNLIDFIPDSQGVVRFPTYLGLRVVQVEDSYFTRAGTTSGFVSRIIFTRDGVGAAGIADPVRTRGAEFVRNPKAGHGSSSEEYISRKRFAMSLPAISWAPATAITTYPTFDAFTDADNWDFNTTHVNEDGDPLSMGILQLLVNI